MAQLFSLGLLTMSIEKLKAIVRPPSRPSDIGSLEEWQTVEQKLGLQLPSDYRDFVFTYGSGLFARIYVVYNPFADSEHVSCLYSSVQKTCQWERDFKKEAPECVPYKIYPERPGLLPWANDDMGNEYFWFTDGAPDTWMVISNEVRGEGYREYGRRMTDFLCDVLTGKIQALAGDYPKDEHKVFEVWNTKKAEA